MSNNDKQLFEAIDAMREAIWFNNYQLSKLQTMVHALMRSVEIEPVDEYEINKISKRLDEITEGADERLEKMDNAIKSLGH